MAVLVAGVRNEVAPPVVLELAVRGTTVEPQRVVLVVMPAVAAVVLAARDLLPRAAKMVEPAGMGLHHLSVVRP